MNIIREYFQTIKIYGQSREIKISIKTEKDNDHANGYINESDNVHGSVFDVYSKSERKKLNTAWHKGDIECVGLIVEVSCALFSGADTLYGVFIKSVYGRPNKSYRDLLNKGCHDIEDIIKSYAMVEDAIKEYERDAKRYKDFFDQD